MGQVATGTNNTAGGSSLEGVGSELPGVGGPGANAGVVGGSDQQILRQHELALQRLEELQSDMIGGEKGGRPYVTMVYIYSRCLSRDHLQAHSSSFSMKCGQHGELGINGPWGR